MQIVNQHYSLMKFCSAIVLRVREIMGKYQIRKNISVGVLKRRSQQTWRPNFLFMMCVANTRRRPGQGSRKCTRGISIEMLSAEQDFKAISREGTPTEPSLTGGISPYLARRNI